MSFYTVRMLEMQWQCSTCRLLKTLHLDGRISAGISPTTNPSQTFFLGFTWTAPNPDCSPWEWTAAWLVDFVNVVWDVDKCSVFCRHFLCLHLSVLVWNCATGGVRLGKIWCEPASHLKLRAHWAKCRAHVYDLVSSAHGRAVSPRYIRPVQD